MLSYFRFILFYCCVFNLFSADLCDISFYLITEKGSGGVYHQHNSIKVGDITHTKTEYTTYRNSVGGGKKSAIEWLKNKLKNINLSGPAKAHLKLENLNNVALDNIKLIYIHYQVDPNKEVMDVPVDGNLRNSEILQSEDNLVDNTIMKSFEMIVSNEGPFTVSQRRRMSVYCYIETSKTQSPKTGSKVKNCSGCCCCCCKK